MPASANEVLAMIRFRVDCAAKALEWDGSPITAKPHLERALYLINYWQHAPSESELQAILAPVPD